MNRQTYRVVNEKRKIAKLENLKFILLESNTNRDRYRPDAPEAFYKSIEQFNFYFPLLCFNERENDRVIVFFLGYLWLASEIFCL